MAKVGTQTGFSAGELREAISDYDEMITRAERRNSNWGDRDDDVAGSPSEREANVAELRAMQAKMKSDLDELESGGGETDPHAPREGNAGPWNPAEQIGDAVEAVEAAAVEAATAAADAGHPEAAEQIGAIVVEKMRAANAELETAAEAVEEAAEEIAEEAPPGSPAAEQAEEAVEAAHEAEEAVEVAEAELREEVRDQGGETEVREAAAVEQVEQVVEEAAETAEPVEAVVAEQAAAPVVRPEPDHPYYRPRKIFGKVI